MKREFLRIPFYLCFSFAVIFSAATFGSQFANSGYRLMIHPGDFEPGSHNLYLVAH